jgi:hypothetical protein
MPARALRCAAAAALTFACTAGFATEDAHPETQRGGTYVEPPESVDPAFLPIGPNGRSSVAGSSGLSVRLSLDYPLRSDVGLARGRGAQGAPAVSPAAQLSLNWHPVQDPAWFVRMGVFRYLQPSRQQPWEPDFSYAFGYDDARPGTLSLVYENYAGNRFRPDRMLGESRANFGQGTWSAGYKFMLPGFLEPYLLVGDGDRSVCRTNLHYTPRFTDARGGPLRHGKTSVALGCRYTRPSGWYAELAVFGYPDRSQQQPWDPDFTYGFGYFDARPGTISVQYGNYSGNRFPGRARAPGEGTLRNGSLSVSWMLSW